MFYIAPDFAGIPTYGNIPRQDHLTDLTSINQNPIAPAAVSEDFIRSFIQREAQAAPNELRLRQSVMTALFERGIKEDSRREILQRAVRYFRTMKKGNVQAMIQTPRADAEANRVNPSAPGPVLYVPLLDELHSDEAPGAIKGMVLEQHPVSEALKSEDSGTLAESVRSLIGKAGSAGIPLKQLAPHAAKHGSQKLSAALKEVGVKIHGDRIFMNKALVLTEKAEREIKPRGADTINDPRADAVGARKIWNHRIVEKKPDGKWHVVGHVAGLEDPKKVPQLDLGKLDREHIVHMLRQLIRIRHAQHGDMR